MKKYLKKETFIGFGIAILIIGLGFSVFQIVTWKQFMDREMIITQNYIVFLDQAAKVNMYGKIRLAVEDPAKFAALQAQEQVKAAPTPPVTQPKQEPVQKPPVEEPVPQE